MQTVKLINKLGQFLKNLTDMGSEKMSERLYILADMSENGQDQFMAYIHSQLSQAASSIIGILSQRSIENLHAWLSLCHALLKGYELFEFARASGYIDEWLFEASEPFSDVDTGYIIPEMNGQFRDMVVGVLAPYAYEEDLDLKALLALIQPLLTAAQDETDRIRTKYYREMRQKLGEGIEGFTEKRHAGRKEIKRQRRSTQQYFTAQNEPNILALSAMMTLNRTTLAQAEPLQLSSLPARAIICAATQAIVNANQHFNLAVPPQSRERMALGDTTIHWQNKPFKHNRGNLFIAGIGRYGYCNGKGKYDSGAVLSLIEEVIQHGVSEVELADMMIAFSRKGQAITCVQLHLTPTAKNKMFVDRINKCLFLTCCAEIWRYMPQINPAEVKVTRVAFANAHARALTLISDGKLTMADVFDEDADFGLPTSTRLTQPDNLPRIIRKLVQLNDRYNTDVVVDYDQTALNFLTRFPEGAIANFTAAHLLELCDQFGKVSVDECDSSDEETKSYLY